MGSRRATQLSLLSLALVFVAECAASAPPDLEFAVQNNRLLVNMHRQFEDRGWHVLYLFMSLLQRHTVPDVYGEFFTLSRDHVPDGPASPFDSSFTFWRPPGANWPRLWPDWDFSGWAAAWIPPMSLVTTAFTEDMVPWAERSPKVYWAGAARLSKTRVQFKACAKAHRKLFAVRNIPWVALRSKSRGPSPKPAAADLRSLLRYKYLIYLPGATWSTSIKRMLVAGAAVLIPKQNQHESMVFEVLKECVDCVFQYDATNVCGSLRKLLATTSDEEAHARAKRLNAFARERFSDASVEAYALHALREASSAQSMSEQMRARIADMHPVDCAWLKARHKETVGVKLSWQVDEWFSDDTCLLRNTTYLRKSAV